METPYLIYYCVKCKTKTNTVRISKSKTRNNRTILKGVCSNCGGTKTTFISKATVGGGFSLNNLINSLPIELN